MLIYLSGPMRGQPDYNFAAFHNAARRLRAMGLDVINPAETAGGVQTLPRDRYIRMDIGYLLAADAVIVLPGWEDSQGAKLETIIADELGLGVFTYDPYTGIGHHIQMDDWSVDFSLGLSAGQVVQAQTEQQQPPPPPEPKEYTGPQLVKDDEEEAADEDVQGPDAPTQLILFPPDDGVH